MRFCVPALACFALLGFTAAAQAADIDYNVTNGTFTTSGSFSGTFAINTSTENVDGGSFMVTAPAGGPNYSLLTFVAGTLPGQGFFEDSMGDILKLNLNGAIGSLALNTFTTNGASGDTEFTAAGGPQFNAAGGTISATPEPSSLILLGTGALGLAGSVRRRLMA